MLLTGISVVITAILAYWFSHRYRVLRHYRHEEKTYSEEQPAVSVVMYTSNDAENIEKYLPIVLNQDYPKYEVIVVNDGYTDTTKDVLGEMEMKYPNLYQTFIPQNARFLSRKKLGLMLGIKAAKYDYILVSNTNCEPSGPEWINSMMRNFTEGIDVVIGYSTYDFGNDKGNGRWYRSYEIVMNSGRWLAYAMSGKPYRGIGDNLAFRKKTFFDNNGFANSINLHYGDDDIFVSEVAREDNTRVEMTPEGMVTSHYENIADAHRELKLRHDFTEKFIRTSAFAETGAMSLLYYLDFALMVAIAAVGWANILNYVIALVLLLALTLPQIILYRVNARMLRMPRLFFSVPIFSLLRPVVNLYYKFVGHKRKDTNYTMYSPS